MKQPYDGSKVLLKSCKTQLAPRGYEVKIDGRCPCRGLEKIEKGKAAETREIRENLGDSLNSIEKSPINLDLVRDRQLRRKT